MEDTMDKILQHQKITYELLAALFGKNQYWKMNTAIGQASAWRNPLSYPLLDLNVIKKQTDAAGELADNSQEMPAASGFFISRSFALPLWLIL